MPKSAASWARQVVYLFGDPGHSTVPSSSRWWPWAISNCEQENGHRLSVFGTDFFVNLGYTRAAAQGSRAIASAS